MTKENSKRENSQRRFSQQQYDMLKRCSKKEDMSEWNEWRKNHPDEDILLERAKLEHAYLIRAYLKDASLSDVHLEHAKLHGAHLEDADLSDANLQGAKFIGARLNGVDMRYAHLQSSDFRRTVVNGSTLLWRCTVDRNTDFRGVGLGSVRIDSGTKQLLEYNIRRKNWEDWYKEHVKLKWLVKPFWWMSDYGLSTGRIIATFFVLAFVFANIYYHWGRIARPGIVENLFVDHNGVAIQWWLVPLRTLYFSIVTQTTLGFGDMYANAHSIFGHILLSIQVILGYVLLGALVTRFAVLFTAGGPAGKFAKGDGKGQ